ncbi:hypothetical protein EV360DRAFT_74879 [Lentinula raphanica]|nr:hypothetical protein EV360DRAFT_74879 [Lentinula raphanica]
MTRFVLRAFLILGAISSSGVLAAPTLTPRSTVSDIQALQSFDPPIGDSQPVVNVLETRASYGLPDWATIEATANRAINALRNALSVTAPQEPQEPEPYSEYTDKLNTALTTHVHVVHAIDVWMKRHRPDLQTFILLMRPADDIDMKLLDPDFMSELNRLREGVYSRENEKKIATIVDGISEEIESLADQFRRITGLTVPVQEPHWLRDWASIQATANRVLDILSNLLPSGIRAKPQPYNKVGTSLRESEACLINTTVICILSLPNKSQKTLVKLWTTYENLVAAMEEWIAKNEVDPSKLRDMRTRELDFLKKRLPQFDELRTIYQDHYSTENARRADTIVNEISSEVESLVAHFHSITGLTTAPKKPHELVPNGEDVDGSQR